MAVKIGLLPLLVMLSRVALSSSGTSDGVTVFFSNSVYYCNESDTFATVTLETSAPSTSEINVTVTVFMGTATFGLDYFTLSQDVRFEPGDQSKSVQIQIFDDQLLEPDEDILLTLFVFKGSLGNAIPGSPSMARLVIVDDEFLGISFSTSEVTIAEGSGFDVQLVSQQAVDVDVTVNLIFTDLTACSADYSTSSTSVTFASGETTSSVLRLTANSNNLRQGVTSLNVAMEFPDDPNVNFHVLVTEPGTLRADLVDDDYVTISFQESTLTVREDVGTISLQLASSGAYSCPFNVSVMCSQPQVGTTTGDAVTSGVSYTVEFNDFNKDESLSTAIEIAVADDKVTGMMKSFTCIIIEPNLDNVLVGDPNTTMVNIEDNDVTIQFTTAEDTIQEGGTLDLSLMAEGTITQDFSVTLVFTNITAGISFGTPSTVTFTTGSAVSSVFTVTSNSDDVWGGTRSFDVQFEFPDGQTLADCLVSGQTDTLKVYVTEDDTVSVSIEGETLLTVREDVGTVSLQLQSEGIYFTAFTMAIVCGATVPPQATADADFIGTPYIVQFSDFNSVQSLSSVAKVEIINDTMAEFTESFVCVVSTPDGEDRRGIVAVDPNNVTISIEDNDDIYVMFQKSEYSVDEEDGTLEVFFKAVSQVSPGEFVPISSPTTFELLVRTVNGTAGGNADFVAQVEVVTFSAGQEFSDPFVVRINNDIISEGPEEFKVMYNIKVDSIPSGTTVKYLDVEATVEIVDNDDITLSFSEQSYSAEEGTSLEVKLKATPFSVPFRGKIIVFPLESGTPEKDCEAVKEVDYRNTRKLRSKGVVNFDPALGQESTSISIPILRDDIVEGTEYFGLTFVLLDMIPFRKLPVDPAIPAIEDINKMLVRFANTTQYTVDEDVGSFDVYFEALREESPGVYVPAEYTFNFQVLVKTVNGTATGDSDFEEKEESVTFSAGDQFSAPFTVKITDDTVAECTQQFTITYSIISTSVKEGAMIELLGDNATVIISDNDESKISFSFGDMTASEGDTLELRLVADNVFETEQFIHLSSEDGPSGDEDDNCVDETDGDSDYLLSSDSEDGEDVEGEDGDGEDDENTPVIVRFPPNSRLSDPFQVDILDDMEVENYENFFLYFSIPEAASSCGARYGEFRSQDILIKDDDGVRIGFEVTSVIRTEGSTVSLKVYRRGCITRAVKVSVGPELITASAKDFQMKKSISFGNVRRCSEKKTFKIKLRKDNDRRDKFLENFAVVMKKANRRGIGFDQRCVNIDILDPTRPTLPPVPRPSIPPITLPTVPSDPPSMPPTPPTRPPGRG